MSRDKRVGIALRGFRKARKTAKAAQRAKLVSTAGQELMHIGLVSDIEQQAVFRGVKHPLEHDAQLDHAEV